MTNERQLSRGDGGRLLEEISKWTLEGWAAQMW